jgi:transposase/IS5 family transposase
MDTNNFRNKPKDDEPAYLIPPSTLEQECNNNPVHNSDEEFATGKGNSNKITYKPYNQHQQHLLPPSIEELIPEGHLSRLVNSVIDEMNILRILEKGRVGGGASRFHPVMMTKVFVYGYLTKVCSSRMLAKALRENVVFMWLSGMQTPDFRTLNFFRGNVLKEVMEEVFVAAVKMLAAKGYVKYEHYFVDGTKIESASGRYTYVWKKTIERHDDALDEKLREYVRLAEKVWDDENEEYGDNDLEELGGKEKFNSADVKELAEKLREKLEAQEEKKEKKKLEKKLKKLEDDYFPRKEKYEQAKELLGDRNSYSKTDTDATFMRLKEDHLGNGQLKPAYNIQVGTENGFVLGYDIFQNPADTRTLQPHLENQKERLDEKPKIVITDAGYGGEENYDYLESEKITALVKYGTYEKEKSKKWQEDTFRTEHWEYNEEEKYYVCPNGKKLVIKENGKEKTTSSGYPVKVDVYECESCEGCPLKEQCTKSKGNRTIERNENWLRLKHQARDALEDAANREIRKMRSVEVETVFGQIKGNQGYRRFLLRGIAKVSTEWGLLALGYNLKQLFRLSKKKTA